MSLKYLTWDIKDTLLRLRLPVGHQYHAEAKKHGLRISPDSLERSFRQAYRAQSRLFPNYGLTQGMTSQQWWLDVVSQTFRLSGVRDEQFIHPVAEKLYQDFSTCSNWEVLPGARETLINCRNLGLRMAVISNFDRRLEKILVQCGLDAHFEFVLTAESAGVAKPDSRIFQKALQLAQVEPYEAVHIGDDYMNDYQAARGVGMHSFLIREKKNYGAEEEKIPDGHVICSLDHLIPKLQLPRI
ncbi:haloacid dehalogenase-like hydrolase domain-containing protein 3 [Pelodytes ibericus]